MPTPLPADVDTVDEMLLVVPRATPLRFEPALGWHLYGADLALQARAAGLRAVVLDVPCYHNSLRAGLDISYWESEAILASKWVDEGEIVTTCSTIVTTGRQRRRVHVAADPARAQLHAIATVDAARREEWSVARTHAWAALRRGRRGRDVARLVVAVIRPLARYRWPPRPFPPATGQRKWARLLGDTYDEWSVLYSPQSDVAQSSPELIDLAVRATTRARDVDLTGVAERGIRDEERLAPVTWPGEHYRILVALAEQWRHGDPVTVVEVGTYAGASALALLSSPVVASVTTFDLRPWDSFSFTVLRTEDFGERLEQRIGDLADPDVFAANADLLAEADMVFVDAPKDGVFEYRFLPRLLRLQPARPQLVVLDDVKVLPMLNLWRSVPLPKLDIASFGHWSGTGLIIREHPVIDWTPPAATLPTPTAPRSKVRA